jgi:hypothetical protein
MWLNDPFHFREIALQSWGCFVAIGLFHETLLGVGKSTWLEPSRNRAKHANLTSFIILTRRLAYYVQVAKVRRRSIGTGTRGLETSSNRLSVYVFGLERAGNDAMEVGASLVALLGLANLFVGTRSRYSEFRWEEPPSRVYSSSFWVPTTVRDLERPTPSGKTNSDLHRQWPVDPRRCRVQEHLASLQDLFNSCRNCVRAK